MKTPLLVAAVSSSLSLLFIGAYRKIQSEKTPPSATYQYDLRAIAGTPERSADYFFSALLENKVDLAEQLSCGEVRRAVLQKSLKTAFFGDRLNQNNGYPHESVGYIVKESHRKNELEVLLIGRAVGRRTGRVYQNEIEMNMINRNGLWFVRQIQVGP